MTEAADELLYLVVHNDEGQYSIWPALGAPPPAGWTVEGEPRPRERCLAHIDAVWTDMRPLSLQRHMAAAADDPSQHDDAEVEAGPTLLERLTAAEHPVELELFSSEPDALARRLDEGMLHVRFPQTAGGTLLGVRLADDVRTRLRAALAGDAAALEVVGELVLDFEPLRCRARIDRGSLRGTGRLERA